MLRKFIKWVADVSGVTREIQIETCKQVGHSMHHDAMWFGSVPKVYNTMYLYSKILKLGHHGAGGAIADLRDKVYKAGDTRIDKC